MQNSGLGAVGVGGGGAFCGRPEAVGGLAPCGRLRPTSKCKNRDVLEFTNAVFRRVYGPGVSGTS